MNVPRAASPCQWEIFCQVVDNFGDIGVCWRLARNLAQCHGLAVRLWVDDWAVFCRLCPLAAAADADAGSHLEGVEVRRWRTPFGVVEPGDVVIEAFACELPDSHLQAMAGRARPPVWINLEYLSAEDWVAGCHGLASPHPRLPLVKRFFFPGFDAGTGGLLREPDLLAQRDAFVRDSARRTSSLAGMGIDALPQDALLVSLFAYEQPGLPGLMHAWSGGERPVLLLVPEGRVLGDVARALGRERLAAGERVVHGRLTTIVLPFSDQAGFDRLLWVCDLDFVRGEDSFVRAQWAARPFVWQIYAQDDAAHHDKLEAFLARYTAGLVPEAADALLRFSRAWNGRGDIAAAWPAFAAALPDLQGHAEAWCGKLATLPELSSRLIEFCGHFSTEWE